MLGHDCHLTAWKHLSRARAVVDFHPEAAIYYMGLVRIAYVPHNLVAQVLVLRTRWFTARKINPRFLCLGIGDVDGFHPGQTRVMQLDVSCEIPGMITNPGAPTQEYHSQ